ncbi:5'-flap endonuclease [Saguinus oedipus]|uniref:5'-flap endonuclease n=1 Tax=Saguinus oedipus TaxID=9490 RepID=A0ABQ9ULL6_SAGOE|nr:5'-flap endonuclease [Saguinus oedipus]
MQSPGAAGRLPETEPGNLHSKHTLQTVLQQLALASGLTQEPVPPLVPPEQSELGMRRSPALHSTPPAGCDSREPSPSASQREHQALQDLMDLAREGFSASQWPGIGGLAGSEGATGEMLGGTLGLALPSLLGLPSP